MASSKEGKKLVGKKGLVIHSHGREIVNNVTKLMQREAGYLKKNSWLPFVIFGRNTLWRLLKRIGFRWRATEDNRKVLTESYDIKKKRILYLRKLREYRQEGRYIVYTDESYIHSSHVQSHGWYDETSKGLKKPIFKGQRLIMVHAGSEHGFIPNGLLIFKSGTKSGDYHIDMNHDNFIKWVEKQLLPNLPQKSVLVVDNAPYHNVTVEKKYNNN